MTRLILCLLFFFSSLLISAQDYQPEVEDYDCPYWMDVLADGIRIECGSLYVPENRDDIDNSYELDLFYVIISAENANNNPPIVYLEGGPGGAASYGFEAWLETRLRDNYDIILIDQRGTGLSYPSLNCYEYDDIEDYLEPCLERLLDEGIDLEAYNSASNAHDIHDLLVALDIPQATIYGTSYGTRLALTMMRDHPERIHSVILDAVYPPHIDFFVEQAINGNQAFEQLFVDCEANPSCNRAYPDLRQTFYETVTRLNKNPAGVMDLDSGEMLTTTGDDFVGEIFALLYETGMLQYLPSLIYAIYDGEYDYDPLFEVELAKFEAELDAGLPIQPDELDLIAMEYLEIDDVDELYDYYAELSDDEFDALFVEVDDFDYYTTFQEYFDFDSLSETLDYLDLLDDDEYYELEIEIFGYYDDDSEGMYQSVECYDETHFNDVPTVLERSAQVPTEIYDGLMVGILDTFDECSLWLEETAPAIENLPVSSDIPTLIFSGLYDPVTPAHWGKQAQTYLNHSWHYVFPNVGHGAIDVEPCATDIALSFLQNPSAEPAHACLDNVSPPDFYIRS